MQSIGVFSGTFDPVHKGHIEACLVAYSILGLKKVLIVIEKNPRRKNNVTAFKHRFEMLDQSIQTYPSLQLIDVQEKNVTVQNCLELLRTQYPDYTYWFIAGSDMLEHLTNWPDVHELLDNFSLCIVLRNNNLEKHVKNLLVSLQTLFPQLKFKILPAVYSEISSSTVKKVIHSTSKIPYIPQEALDYARKHKLYN